MSTEPQRRTADSSAAVGAFGWVFINDTQPHNGRFSCVKAGALGMTVAALEGVNCEGSPAAEAYDQGYEILGTLTRIQLSSGTCYAYKLHP